MLALGLFATLVGAVIARDLVQKSRPDNIQPFIGWLPDSTWAAIAIMAAFTLVIGVVAYCFLSRFDRISQKLGTIRGPHFLRLQMRKRDVITCAAIILVLWLPVLAIMYPCGMTVDTYNQLYQFVSGKPTFYPTVRDVIDAEFIDHHPVFDTLLYGTFWKIGFMAGSQKAGLFALVILQSLVLSLELGFVVCYLEKLRVPWVLRAAALAFFALFPMFPHYAATVLKDVTYLTFFIPWLLIWLEATRTRGAVFSKPAYIASFFVLGGLCVMSKKLGLFLLAPCLIALIIVVKTKRLPLLGGSIATLAVVCALIPALVYPAIGGVAPGGRQESLGPAIQHLTALMIEKPSAVSAEERDELYEVYYVDLAQQRYESYRSDGAKSTFRSSASTQEIIRMLQIWASKGVQHPMVYLKSTLQTSGMLFIPFMKITYYYDEDYSMQRSIYRGYCQEFSAVEVEQSQKLIDLNKHLEFDSVESKISDLPIVSLFFSEGFYGGWVPYIALVLVLFARAGLRSRHKALPAQQRSRSDAALLLGLFPILVSVALFVISPVASPRYILHLMFTAPLILGWAWFALETQGDVQ